MEHGGDPDAFWRQTPRLLMAFFDAKERADDRHYRLAMAQAYYAGLLSHPLKPYPKLSDLTDPAKPAQPQGWEEQLAVVRALDALFHGTPPA